ncbi:hypothetical protein PLICRDRAFT_180677 [Plicaturopsis crispa FD-325 SS-3]|uniref:Uncharacterized protein n=1 Tax=Plicaturopsis crispa FD-325 SS-3 TaxID=944288 RepID=A0A0C9T4R6_PLICR|nr:hypothetical protein PLICRDRAFT_180677 [Plicaturopsis crispa FD-325 SS-3]
MPTPRQLEIDIAFRAYVLSSSFRAAAPNVWARAGVLARVKGFLTFQVLCQANPASHQDYLVELIGDVVSLFLEMADAPAPWILSQVKDLTDYTSRLLALVLSIRSQVNITLKLHLTTPPTHASQDGFSEFSRAIIYQESQRNSDIVVIARRVQEFRQWMQRADAEDEANPIPPRLWAIIRDTGDVVPAPNIRPPIATILAILCTAAVTEVSYADIDEFSARISFVSEIEWRQTIQEFLNGSSDSLARSRALQVYPQIRGHPSSSWSVDDLVSQDHVASRLGQEINISAPDAPELQEKIKPFLSALLDDPDQAMVGVSESLWPLVETVYIKGKFDVLSNITLVDLPGYCFADPSRAIAAEIYMKTANHVLLVAEAKTVYANVAVNRYIEKSVQVGVINGTIYKGILTVALTGTDIPIGDRDVQLNGEQSARVEKLKKIQMDARKEERSTGYRGQEMLDLRERYTAALTSKHVILSNARAVSQSQGLNDIYQKAAMRFLARSAQPPRLPVFSIATRDYLSILGIESSPPSYFEKEQDTGIPQLQQHIRNIGE